MRQLAKLSWRELKPSRGTSFASRGEAPAWGVSLVVHLLLIIVLGTLTIYRPEPQRELTVATLDTELEELQRAVEVSHEPSTEPGAEGLSGHEAAMALAPEKSEIANIQPTRLMTLEAPTIVLRDELNVATAQNTSETLLIKGEIGVGVTSAMGAIDRITQEILVSLEQRPTLVVWLFDQSGSLDATRAAIYERFDRIYQELGILQAGGSPSDVENPSDALVTSVMAFGADVSFLTRQPTADLAEIKEAIARIENDPTGNEMVFTAVEKAATRFRKYRTSQPRRNVMLIVVSDEVGNDEQRIEKALTLCRRLAMPVYVVGVPAPFGRRQALVKYIDPDPKFDQREQMIGVDQGPESAVPERLMLSFSAPQQRRTLEQIDSGFGPFYLTRLCYETGGIYFAVHPNKDEIEKSVKREETPVLAAVLHHFFEHETMRRYRPNYVSHDDYRRMVEGNRASAALVAAAQMSRVEPMESPQLRFPKLDDASLKGLLDRAQQAAAKLQPKLEALYQVLKAGEADREELTMPRWEAGYDLAMGRVLAVKIRTQGYNAMLAALKQGQAFRDPQNDTWVLKPADSIEVDSRLDRMGGEARDYLARVVEEHPGTPWALLAAEEMKAPMGWKWDEMDTGVQRRARQARAGNNRRMPRDDQLRKIDKPKPKRTDIRL